MSAGQLGIVGLAARFGGFADLDAVEAALYDGRRGQPAPADGPAGGPADLDGATALARTALTDCRVPAGGPVAVLAGGPDAAAAGRTATELAARLRLTGPVVGRSLAALRTGWLDETAGLLGSGAAAQVLVVATDGCGAGAAFVLAPAAESRGYAVVGHPTTPVAPPGPAHVELDCRIDELDRACGALAALMPDPARPALGVSARAGDLGWAEAIVRAALALRGNFVPGTRTDDPAREPARRSGLHERFPLVSRPWLRTARGPRRAAVLCVEPPRLTVLTEVEAAHPRARPLVPTAPVTLVAVRAPDVSALLRRLETLEAEPGAALARARRGQVEGAGPAPLHVGLVAADAAGLRSEIEACRRAIGTAAGGPAELTTPRGSALTRRPLAGAGSVAFMYPGAFSAYPGVGRDAFRLFEQSLAGMAALTGDPAGAFAVDRLYPSFSGRPTAREIAAAERALADEPLAVMSASMSYSVLFTRVLRDVFGVQPDLAFGYSLGESSMLRSLGVWDERDADARMAALHGSALFRTRLSGPLDAVREYWTRQLDAAGTGWDVVVVLAEPEAVEAALAGERGTWVSIVNGPREVVVCGDPDGCAKLVARLGCEHVRMPYRQALHAPPAETELAEFVRLNRNRSTAVDRPVFLSAASRRPLVLEQESLARRLSEMAVRRLDFPALVERAYAAGARVFVEVGPGAMLTRLVGAILEGREHVAIPVDRRGVDAQTSLVRLLSRLHAHHVPLDVAGWGPGASTGAAIGGG